MGKSTAAKYFRRLHVPVYDADGVVHELLGNGGAGVAAIRDVFKGVVTRGRVDRKALGERVFDDVNALAELEAIVHPLVSSRQLKFLKIAASHRQPLVVLDVPLLFETGGDTKCDAVAVASAPEYLQKIKISKSENKK